MWIRRQRVPIPCPLIPPHGGPEGAGIWLRLLTSQSGSSEPCLKGLSGISAAAKPGEPGEPAGSLIFIGVESNEEQLVDSSERLPPLLISANAHFDIKKEKRLHLLHHQQLQSPCFVFLSPDAIIPSLYPHFHVPRQDLIKAQQLHHTDPYLNLNKTQLPRSPAAPIPLKPEKEARF